MTKLVFKSELSLEAQAKIFRAKNLLSVRSAQEKLALSSAGTSYHSQNKSQTAYRNNPKRQFSKVITQDSSYLEKIKAIQSWLERGFPEAFDRKHPKPLKRRVLADILKITPPMFAKTQVRDALSAYTNRAPYLKSMLTHKHRYDLSGKAIEEITEAQFQYSRDKLLQKHKEAAVANNSKKLNSVKK